MPKNCYDDNSFFTNSYGFKAYKDNDSTISTVGIDVSYVQGDIDWEMVKSSGVDYAIIRCGGRGYGESGILYEDEKFEQNIQGAIDAGLDVGVYFYSQAISVEEAKEEAEYTLKLIKNYDIKYPVVFDWEHYEYEDARTDDVDRETLTSIAKQYCSVVDKAGYTPVIYANRSILYFEYDLAALSDIELWLASYEDVPDFYYDFGMWQYSTDGTIDGIDGTVDLNICMYNY
jgi:GH25 family lysozyme M1 (1,4-beta-N-acetylmuramidase)